MASSSRMTAARTCSCTSAPWSGPGLERCAKVRRSPTRSWPTAVQASRRPTICAFLADPLFGFAPEDPARRRSRAKAAPMARPFCFAVQRPQAMLVGGAVARRGVVEDADRLARTGIGDVTEMHACSRHHIADRRHILIADLA